MGKVKDLNLVLDFGQKNLEKAQLSTKIKYRQTLRELCKKYHVLLPEINGPIDLDEFQAGMKKLLKEFKLLVEDRDAYLESITSVFREPLCGYRSLEIDDETGFFKAVQSYTGTTAEIGEQLLFLVLLEMGEMKSKDFGECKICGHVFVKQTKKSTICSQLCHVVSSTIKKRDKLAEKAG